MLRTQELPMWCTRLVLIFHGTTGDLKGYDLGSNCSNKIGFVGTQSQQYNFRYPKYPNHCTDYRPKLRLSLNMQLERQGDQTWKKIHG